ncbi:MAG TPA: PilW family protein [Usitatibacter sp.]|nr:PilW family protein [Usitatibacter sp.]
MREHQPRAIAARRRMAGLSLVELMIAIAIGLVVMAALTTIFANSSRARQELERNSRQIENGRFAIELLASDLRLAGFYGEFDPRAVAAPAALQDPCSTDPLVWAAAFRLHVQGYDNGAGYPADCAFPSLKAGTDIVAIRRASTCEAGVGSCPAAVGGYPYIQLSKCATEQAATPYVLGLQGAVAFPLRLRDCATTAGIRQYYVRIYYISTDNGAALPSAVPTLKRRDFTGSGFVDTPLVEGIEEFNVEYGIDIDGDGLPDAYSADPTGYTCPSGCDPVSNWMNVVTARIYLLARNIDPSPGYTDVKTYNLGNDAGGAPITVTPGGPYHRHAYTTLVRIVNAAQRRETP